VTTLELAELILARLYALAEKEGHSRLFSVNDIAAEFGVEDKARVLNVAKVLENRGLIKAAHTFGGSDAAITGEGALLVESGGDTGVIGDFKSSPQSFGAGGKEPTSSVRDQEPLRSVFVVHGHDEEVKLAVARYLETLDLQPVILHEQPSQGLTLIEKLERYADVGFAVVLLTPDDLGRSKAADDERPRARQNVIFEMGYFFALLGRDKVVALHQEVDLPTDISGVVYTQQLHWKLVRIQLSAVRSTT